MNELFRNLASPSWWRDVIIVAFLINLAAAYAKPIIDRSWARTSDRRQRQLETLKLKLEQQLGIIERTPYGIVLLALEELMLVLAAGLMTSVCILVLLLLASPLPGLHALAPHVEFLAAIPPLLILAMFCMRQANAKGILLRQFKSKHDQKDS